MEKTFLDEYQTEEIQTRFLEHIHYMVDYCDNEPRLKTTKDKLELLAFSILVAIDGDSMSLPSFVLAPATINESGYPDNTEIFDKVKCDISGNLHERFYTMKNDN